MFAGLMKLFGEQFLNRSFYSVQCPHCCNGKFISYQPWKLTNHPGRKIQGELTLYRAAKWGELYKAARELSGKKASALFFSDNALLSFGLPEHVPVKSLVQFVLALEKKVLLIDKSQRYKNV